MMIMPLSGNDIGFGAKSWKRLEAAVAHKSQVEVDADDAYWGALFELPVVSMEVSKVETEVYDEDRNNWTEYFATVKVMLSGNVPMPVGVDSADVLPARISEDFAQAYNDNDACNKALSEAQSELPGEKLDAEDGATVEVKSLIVNPDGTAKVVIELSVRIKSGESAADAKGRADDERGETLGQLERDMS